MSELLKIKCEFCENLMSVKEELVGKKVKCPKCATVIEIKLPEVESSEEEKPEPKPAAETGGGGFHMTRMLSAPTFKRKASSGKKKAEVTKDKTPLIIGGILVFVTLIVILLVLWFVVLKKPKDTAIAPKATPGAPAPVK